MSSDVGQWKPKRGDLLDLEVLKRLAAGYSAAPEKAISDWLSVEEVDRGKAMMKTSADNWVIAQALSNEEMIALVRFFTLAEMQLSGWDGGKDSPVIPLVRILKAREGFSADLRRWIKSNTDNRYLPNGSAL